MIVRSIVLFILILWSGCQNQVDQSLQTKKLIELLISLGKNQEVLEQSDYIFILPLENGCSSCIRKGIEYVKILQDNDSFTFILSANSYKKINEYFTEIELSKKNFIQDGRSQSKSHGLIVETPVLFAIKDAKVIDIKTLTSLNIEDELSKLMKKADFDN